MRLATSTVFVGARSRGRCRRPCPARRSNPPPRRSWLSPDGRIEATLSIGEEIRYALAVDGRPLLAPAPVSLSLADGRVLGRGARVLRVERKEIDETIPTPLGKRAAVRNAAAELALVLSDGATLRARAYDDGLALRWETALPGRVRVRDEGFVVAFPEEPKAFFLAGPGPHHGYEGLWRHAPISALESWDEKPPHGVAAARLRDRGRSAPRPPAGRRGRLPRPVPRVPLEPPPPAPRRLPAPRPARGARRVPRVRPRRDRARRRHRRDGGHPPLPVAGVRRRPPGRRSPRERHGDPARSPPAPGSDFSWVKPGKVVWDYWANWNLEGVDFPAGRNDATFRYHVDFAARNGFEYVNVDWMWTDPHDLFATNPDVDVPGLVQYAREKGVGIFVWCLARTLERQLQPALDRFQKWGVGGPQDRLLRPGRPADDEPLPPLRGGGGEAEDARPLPRRDAAHRPLPRVPERPRLRGRPRPRVRQVQRAGLDPAARGDDPLHADARGADGLHAGGDARARARRTGRRSATCPRARAPWPASSRCT